MNVIIGGDFRAFSTPGSMGVVTDTRYIFCYWPALEKPVSLFADGSSGIHVLGSSRNIVFPAGTVFETYYPDALYPAELAVKALGRLKKLINLNADETAAWLSAYDAAVASFPATHAVHSSKSDCFFLVETVNKSRYVAELSVKEADDLVTGVVTKESLSATKEFKDASTGEVLVKAGK